MRGLFSKGKQEKVINELDKSKLITGIDKEEKNKSFSNVNSFSFESKSSNTQSSAAKAKQYIEVNSLIDGNNKLTKKNWVIALGRKEAGNTLDPEHAFLIMEGINNEGDVFIGRYEFGLDDDRNGIVRTKKAEGVPSEIKEIFDNILWGNTPKEVKAKIKDVSDGWYKKSWSITKEQGEKLVANINKDKASPPMYSSIGSQSISGASNVGSLKKGHNCFSWARQKLIDLEDPRIENGLQTRWLDKLVSVSSQHLSPEGKTRSGLKTVSSLSAGRW